jgi:hypothetical protein
LHLLVKDVEKYGVRKNKASENKNMPKVKECKGERNYIRKKILNREAMRSLRVFPSYKIFVSQNLLY